MTGNRRVGLFLRRLPIERLHGNAARQKRGQQAVKRRVRAHFAVMRLPSGEHQLVYQTDGELSELGDERLFAISGEAFWRGCVSEAEARLLGTERQW